MRGPLLFVDLIPELRDLPEDSGAHLAWKYYHKSLLHWESWLGYAGLAGCLYLWDKSVSYFSNILEVKWVAVYEMLSLLVFGMLGALIHNLLVAHAISREIRKQRDS